LRNRLKLSKANPKIEVHVGGEIPAFFIVNYGRKTGKSVPVTFFMNIELRRHAFSCIKSTGYSLVWFQHDCHVISDFTAILLDAFNDAIRCLEAQKTITGKNKTCNEVQVGGEIPTFSKLYQFFRDFVHLRGVPKKNVLFQPFVLVRIILKTHDFHVFKNQQPTRFYFSRFFGIFWKNYVHVGILK